jgi:hypothetical protein
MDIAAIAPQIRPCTEQHCMPAQEHLPGGSPIGPNVAALATNREWEPLDPSAQQITAIPQFRGCPHNQFSSSGTQKGSWARILSLLSRSEWLELLALALAMAALHIVGWFVLGALVVPHHYRLGKDQGIFGVGLAITAYTLGMRHAFDADHIAAIDNTMRKLMGEGGRPLSVGFWFSLGHSSVVFLASVIIT